jgi:transposase
VTARATRAMPRNWRASPSLIPRFCVPIAHRTLQQQQVLTLIRARDLMVRLRTAAVNAVHGPKSSGHRMFCQTRLGHVASWTGTSARSGVEQIAEMTTKIKQYDRQIRQLTERVCGDTSSAEGLWRWSYHSPNLCADVGRQTRFQRSRDVECYLGLRPRRSQSAD